MTKNPDGTITLAVYQQSGIAAANARLHGTLAVNAHGIPAGDILVIGVATSGHTPRTAQEPWPRPRRRAA